MIQIQEGIGKHYCNQIGILLRKNIGLEVNNISSQKLLKAIEIRRLACGLANLETYFKHLQTSPSELIELTEYLVVPETWFFRHREAFVYLSRYLKTEWLPRHPQGILKILSLPCATGEEPYSLAMTLLEAGLTPKQFRIDGIDISAKALAKAKQGIYGNNSFRRSDYFPKKAFFETVSQGYQVCEFIRQSVTFRQGNLFNLPYLHQKSYHLIFCRHLLIYLDSEARSRAIDRLDQLLLSQGLLFVGAAETGLFKKPQFCLVSHPYAFVFQKKELQKTVKLELMMTKSEKKAENNPMPIGETQPQLSSLEIARNLADKGKLEEATQLCQSFLQDNSASAAGYLLLGEIEQAKGNIIQAEAAWQKALYLQPSYYEALVHLALLKENRGDFHSASVIKQRIQRLYSLNSD